MRREQGLLRLVALHLGYLSLQQTLLSTDIETLTPYWLLDSSSRPMPCWNGFCIQEFMTYMEFNSKVQNQSCMLQRGARINICLT